MNCNREPGNLPKPACPIPGVFVKEAASHSADESCQNGNAEEEKFFPQGGGTPGISIRNTKQRTCCCSVL
jgi:hypothetical protein